MRIIFPRPAHPVVAEPTKAPGESGPSASDGEKDEGDGGKGSPLEQYTQNLNQAARDGREWDELPVGLSLELGFGRENR